MSYSSSSFSEASSFRDPSVGGGRLSEVVADPTAPSVRASVFVRPESSVPSRRSSSRLSSAVEPLPPRATVSYAGSYAEPPSMMMPTYDPVPQPVLGSATSSRGFSISQIVAVVLMCAFILALAWGPGPALDSDHAIQALKLLAAYTGFVAVAYFVPTRLNIVKWSLLIVPLVYSLLVTLIETMGWARRG